MGLLPPLLLLLLLLLQWFNRMLEEMWPYYDRGICSTIKSTLEPIIESYRCSNQVQVS
jgi:hypothetical protein